MGALSSLQSGLNSLSGGLSKTLQFAEGALSSAATISSSLQTLQANAANAIKPSAGKATTGALALSAPVGPPAPAASSSSVPTLLLFVAALVVVVLIARK